LSIKKEVVEGGEPIFEPARVRKGDRPPAPRT
jgi:hypothetical protein